MPRFILLFLAVLSSCAPRTLPSADPSSLETIAGIPVGDTLPPSALIDGDHAVVRNVISDHSNKSTTPLTAHRKNSQGITLLTFDSRTHSLEVVDNENGPGTGATTSKTAAKKHMGVAAINGGFFTPEGQPLGLVYENATKYGGLSTSSLGAGVYLNDPEARSVSLMRRTFWQKSGSSPNPAHLLQSGPFLVENGKSVSELSRSRPRPRSFLLWNGAYGWAIGHSSSTTLAALSKSLASQPIPGFQIHHALNLDGGSSCDFWIAPAVKGGPVSIRPLWAKNVRNYLVLTPRHP